MRIAKPLQWNANLADMEAVCLLFDSERPKGGWQMDIVAHNRAFWDGQVEARDRWTRTVGSEEVERARQGEFALLLTPTKAVPRAWFGELKGTRTLCLASGGGQ